MDYGAGGMLDRGREVMRAPEAMDIAPCIHTRGMVIATIERGRGLRGRSQQTDLEALFGLEQNKTNTMLLRHRMQDRTHLNLQRTLIPQIDIRKVLLASFGFLMRFGVKERHLTTTTMRGNARVDKFGDQVATDRANIQQSFHNT